jgi:hypothetical protein
MSQCYLALGLAVVLIASPSVAKDESVASPLIDALERCLLIQNSAERLACTDVAARRLVDASRRRDVVIVDRDEMKKTRKSLFGFALPRIGLFGKGGPDSGDEVDRVESVIARVAMVGYGKIAITLDDGARWTTTDAWADPLPPKVGATLIIKRGAIGSYMVSVEGGRSVRAMRVG